MLTFYLFFFLLFILFLFFFFFFSFTFADRTRCLSCYPFLSLVPVSHALGTIVRCMRNVGLGAFEGGRGLVPSLEYTKKLRAFPTTRVCLSCLMLAGGTTNTCFPSSSFFLFFLPTLFHRIPIPPTRRNSTNSGTPNLCMRARCPLCCFTAEPDSLEPLLTFWIFQPLLFFLVLLPTRLCRQLTD
ncbi:hypothetical protein F5X96DRAFT_416640 [Biscogniauxia mediterranea]|nr:hypothetical protein F5X96DRAFT_416640 [Biscogniauxia mediterranea]